MNHNFLATIIEHKRLRVERLRAEKSVDELKREARDARTNAEPHRLLQALQSNEKPFNIIAEYKRASPSKGIIRADLIPSEVAKIYERGGAIAVSVLTEEDFFKGSLDDLRAVRAACSLPILRKDFTIDESQIYEAATAGADAILLIAALLTDEQLADFRHVAEDELSMDALIEVHTKEEMQRAINCGARIIGVNNRNLQTFNVSLETSVELIKDAPSNAVLISESGLQTKDDFARLRGVGYQGFLVGEILMRARDAESELRGLIGTSSINTTLK